MIRPLVVLLMLIGQCYAASVTVSLYDDGQTFFNEFNLNDGRFCEQIFMEPVFGISSQSFGQSSNDASAHVKYDVESLFYGSSLQYEMSFTSVNRDTSWSTLIDGNRLETKVFSVGKA